MRQVYIHLLGQNIDFMQNMFMLINIVHVSDLPIQSLVLLRTSCASRKSILTTPSDDELRMYSFVNNTRARYDTDAQMQSSQWHQSIRHIVSNHNIRTHVHIHTILSL